MSLKSQPIRPGSRPVVTGLTAGPATSETVVPELLTADEVAAVLRTTRSAVYAMIARGQLPGVLKIGRRLLVDRRELLAWLEERRAMSPAERRR